MDASQEDIRFVETSATDALMPTSLGWEILVILGLLLLFALILTWIVRHRHQKNVAGSQNPIKSAYNEALEALAVCPTESETLVATECSLIMRRYLAVVAVDPALFETHEEWIARHNAVKSLSDPLKAHIHQLFEQLAEWKYVPSNHGDDPAMMVDRSRNLLEAIHQEAVA